MVESNLAPPEALDAVFHALSDPTRRAMVQQLSQREHTVTELAEPFSMSLAGASKHLKVLEAAGLVRRRFVGRTHYCRLSAERLAAAHRWLAHYEKFWSASLDALEALLRAEDNDARCAPPEPLPRPKAQRATPRCPAPPPSRPLKHRSPPKKKGLS